MRCQALCKALSDASKERQCRAAVLRSLCPVGNRERVRRQGLYARDVEVDVPPWPEEAARSLGVDLDGDLEHLLGVVGAAEHRLDLAPPEGKQGVEVGQADEARKHVKAPEGASDEDAVGKVAQSGALEKRDVVPHPDEDGDGDEDVEGDKGLIRRRACASAH